MNKIEFRKHMQGIYDELVKLSTTKGEEYTQRDTDALENFKRVGKQLNLPPDKILMVYLQKHLDAISSYIKTGTVLSEPIQGRIHDAILYLMLLSAMIEELDKTLNTAPSIPKPKFKAPVVAPSWQAQGPFDQGDCI